MSASGQHDPYGYQGEPAGGYAAQPAEREGSYGSSASDPYAVSGPYSASDPYAVQDSFSSPDPYSPHSSSAAQNPYAAPYAGPGHPPGGPSPWMQPPRQTSSMALAGFVVSLVSLVMYSLAAPVGLVLSLIGMRDTGASASTPQEGRGFAIAGLVLSILGCLALLAVIAYFVLVIVGAVLAA